MLKNLYKLILLLILVAGLSIAGTYFYLNFQKNLSSPRQAAQKAIDYINQNLLSGQTAFLINAVEENGLYKFRLKVGENEFISYITKDGKILFPQEGIDLEKKSATQPKTQEEKTYTIGDFAVNEDEICREQEKPIVYFFGSKSCPHCQWEHPIVENVTKNFEEYISFHNNMDSNENTDIFSKYSAGGIPTLVFGCKYSRVGSGEQSGKEEEIKNLTALICKLTANQPSDVCNSVQNLVEQIK